MQKYIGVKKVEAEPMTRGEYAKLSKRNSILAEKGESERDEGYHVRYSDGYESWSPKSTFEEAYSEVGTNPLKDTTFLMCSKDYKERFLAEYVQLAVRLRKLESMLSKWHYHELNFNPTCDDIILTSQVHFMKEYMIALETRAAMEDIKLPDINKIEVD